MSTNIPSPVLKKQPASVRKGTGLVPVNKSPAAAPPAGAGDDHRTFKPSSFGEYSSPKMKPSVRSIDFGAAREKKVPVFLGGNGQLFDIHYAPIDKSHLTNGVPQDPNVPHYDPSVKLAGTFPEPEQYESFFDYEQALLDWKLTLETALGGIRLPNVMGRKYSRPRASDYESGSGDMTVIAAMDDDRRRSSEVASQSTPDEDGIPKEDGQERQAKPPAPVLSEDPWDAILVPVEPQPSDYDTFTEYEEALIKWAHLCSAMTVLPPHAAQLKELIPIQVKHAVAEAVSQSTEQNKKNEPEREKWKVRTGYKPPSFFETHVIPKWRPTYTTAPVEWKNLQSIKEFRLLPPPAKARVQKFIADMLAAQNEKLEKYGSYNKPLLPIIHGTLPKPWDTTRGSGSNANKITIRNSKYRTLRRTDLTGPMISSCMDCAGEVDGNKVAFDTPEFDIDNIDLPRLANDHTYLEQTVKTVVHLQHYDRYDQLNSWFHPHIPQDVHNKHREYINYLIMSTPAAKFDVSVLCEILSGEMFLDKFQDLLGETCREEEDGSSKSYLQLFIGCVTPENFPNILALFDNGNSPLLHAKLSAFISETAQSAKGKVLFERLIVNKDIKSLSFVAYAITYFSEVQTDVFPWHMDAYWSVKKFLGANVEPLLVVFCFYYVNIICQTINKQPFLFVGLNYFINDARKGLANQLGQVLQNYPDFVGKYVFQGISSRLQTISQTFMFVMVQLLTQQNLESPLVQVCLRSVETDLVTHIKELTDSKYLHVQLAARRLFAIISNEPWQDFLFTEYSNNPDQFQKDLTHSANPARQSLLSGLILDMAFSALDKANATEQSRKRIAFLMDEALFHTLVQMILKTRAVDAITATVSALLAQLAKTYYRLNLITPTLNVKTSHKRTGTLSLTVSPLDLQKLLNYVSEVSGGDPNFLPIVKRNLLMMYRRLIKSPEIFDFVRKEKDFYSRLQGFCREGTLPQLEFNKEAWKMLYQIVYNHHGTMEHMIKNELLHPILELIATFSPNVVVMNGLQCISKMFSMLADEQRAPKRKDIKTVEKDIKNLSTLFVSKRLFVKIHMIYRKYIPNVPGTSIPILSALPGAAFSALAHFYYILQNAPGCGRLLKDTLKTQEYKDGLQFINNMHASPVLMEEASNSPTPGGVKKPAPSALSSVGSKLPGFLSMSRGAGDKK